MSVSPLATQSSVACSAAGAFGSRASLAGRLRAFSRAILVTSIAILLPLVVAVALQLKSGAFQSELAGYPDEAAHYVTGLMVHDYLAAGAAQPPMRYALDYYLHYPKVGFGHWPPLLYVVEAAWMGLFSDSIVSVLLLMAFLTATCAAVLGQRVAKRFGPAAGAVMACLFVALPIVQEQTVMVMAESLLTLLCLLAALAFADYLESEQWRDCAWYGVFTTLAILTKGNGWALGLVPPIALLLTHKWKLLKRPAMWLTAVGVLAAALPWQLLTMRLVSHGWASQRPSAEYTLTSLVRFTQIYAEMAGVVLFVVAVIGLAATVLRAYGTGDRVAGEPAALLGLLVAVLVFHSVVPAGVEARKLVLAAPALLMFVGYGSTFLIHTLARVRWNPGWTMAGAAAIFAVTAFSIPVKHSRGLAAVAEATVAKSASVTLISADANGEGAFIAEVAMRDERPNKIVLRASKILSRMDWNGTDYKSRFETVEQMRQFIDATPVQRIVVEDAESTAAWQHHTLLKQMLAASKDWMLAHAVHSEARTRAVWVFEKVRFRREQPKQTITAEAMLAPILPSGLMDSIKIDVYGHSHHK